MTLRREGLGMDQIATYPVFRSLTDKGTLITASAGIALDGMSACPYEVVELG